MRGKDVWPNCVVIPVRCVFLEPISNGRCRKISPKCAPHVGRLPLFVASDLSTSRAPNLTAPQVGTHANGTLGSMPSRCAPGGPDDVVRDAMVTAFTREVSRTAACRGGFARMFLCHVGVVASTRAQVVDSGCTVTPPS